MDAQSINISTMPDDTQVSPAWGYAAVLVTGLCFGSASLPIKKCESGDGVTFQLASALAFWSIGVAINCIRLFPDFFFLPMLGGVFFGVANAEMVPILKTIGIGMGTSIRASIGIVVGWVDARYGIFGTIPEKPANPIENYVGVALSIIGALLFLFVKSSATEALSHNTTFTTSHNTTDISDVDAEEPLLSNGHHNYHDHHDHHNHLDHHDHHDHSEYHYDHYNHSEYQRIDHSHYEDDEGKMFLINLSPLHKRILGIVLSVTAGICVGLAYIPYLYVIDRYKDASKNGLDYVFSMFTGVLVASFVYFFLYCVYKHNNPYVNRRSIIPGFINGWLWGIGACCFQFANSILSQAITFPIALGLQSLIGVLYGVLWFKEIKGKLNFIYLAIGFTATVVGSVLTGASK